MAAVNSVTGQVQFSGLNDTCCSILFINNHVYTIIIIYNELITVL